MKWNTDEYRKFCKENPEYAVPLKSDLEKLGFKISSSGGIDLDNQTVEDIEIKEK